MADPASVFCHWSRRPFFTVDSLPEVFTGHLLRVISLNHRLGSVGPGCSALGPLSSPAAHGGSSEDESECLPLLCVQPSCRAWTVGTQNPMCRGPLRRVRPQGRNTQKSLLSAKLVQMAVPTARHMAPFPPAILGPLQQGPHNFPQFIMLSLY